MTMRQRTFQICSTEYHKGYEIGKHPGMLKELKTEKLGKSVLNDKKAL